MEPDQIDMMSERELRNEVRRLVIIEISARNYIDSFRAYMAEHDRGLYTEARKYRQELEQALNSKQVNL